MLLYWFHRMRSVNRRETSAIHPRTGENRKRMKQNRHLNMQKQAGTYEEASDRSGEWWLFISNRELQLLYGTDADMFCQGLSSDESLRS
jgi:hypothetical protein